ncbi:MAG TPA: ABC transporter permease [Williamwhitmania sp.]|nr:ABC transporter permease [Williamwhitmania sp.]
MLKSIFLIAFRNLKKQRFFSLINILGLSLGLGIAVVIISFILFEKSFDTFYPNYQNIYRIAHAGDFNGKKVNAATSPLPEAPAVLEDIPEVAAATRLYSMPENSVVKVKDSKFLEKGIFLTDSLFFKVFNISVSGDNPEKILGSPNYAYLSEATAKKFFGNQDPTQQTIEIKNRVITIAGTFKDFPTNSHIHPQIVANLKLLFTERELNAWGGFGYLTYVLLKDGSNVDTVQAKIARMFYDRIGKVFVKMGVSFVPYLQRVDSIHLHSSLMGEAEPNGDFQTIYIFSAIALLILIIAVANYMNLSTARFSRRAKEVGIRKVSGARKGMLTLQFLGESIVLSLISLIIALVLAQFLSPILPSLLHRNIDLNLFNANKIFFYYLPVTIVVGLLAGSYPAYFLSSFKPITTLKGKVGNARRSIVLRKVLTLVQLFITIGLIICTYTVYSQLQYLNHKDLGFNRDNILILPLPTKEAAEKADLLKEKILNIPGVASVSATSCYPGNIDQGEGFVPEGFDSTQTVLMFRQDVDYDYFKTIGATMHSGRFFSKDFPTDVKASIINQTAQKLFGWKDAVGKTIRSAGGQFVSTVIGVYNDMNIRSLHDPIQPAIILLTKQSPSYLLLHTDGNTKEIVKQAEKEWNSTILDSPFQYSFLDEELAKSYVKEKMLGSIFLVLTILAIIIANLGLLGLSVFNTERRRKEISVRKVLGADRKNIVTLFLKEYGIQIVLASFISWPLAYYLMQRWLENFPYRTTLSPIVFVGASVIASVIVLLAVGYTVVKAANTNPAESLKYE